MLRAKLRVIFSFPVALGAILVTWVALVAGQSVADPDIWWHLRNAANILSNGKFLRFDTYSWTAAGHPWIDHEWLAEIPYYLAWRAGGLVGVYLLYITLLSLILLGVFYLAYRAGGNLKGAFLVSCYSVLMMAVSYGPRTILFGYLYFIILIYLLWRYRAEGKAPLWLIPILFGVWVNTHGSWLLGTIVFATFFVCGLVQGQWGPIEAVRWTPQQLRSMFATGVASFAALFVNPYTYRLVFYPFNLAFRQKLNVAHVEEWMSVDFHNGRGKFVFILLALFLLGAIMSRVQWRLEEVALILFALYCGLTYIRFLFMAAILLAPVLTRFLRSLPPYRPEIDKPALNAVIILGLAALLFARVPTARQLEEDVNKKYPAGALAYFQEHPLRGPFFNEYIWGGYLGWHDPRIKSFVDSRTDIFEYIGVLKDYLEATGLQTTFEVFDKYKIQTVLYPAKDPLSYVLEHSPGWKVAYRDDLAVVFERDGPVTANAPAASGAGGGH